MSVALPKNGAPAAGSAGGAGTGDLILTLTDRGDYYLGKQNHYVEALLGEHAVDWTL